MLSVGRADGGHLSQVSGGTPTDAHLLVREMPFDADSESPGGSEGVRAILENRPQLVMLGASLILRPESLLKELIAAAHEVGAFVVYDASHVIGLIAGGRFPNPLSLGADLL